MRRAGTQIALVLFVATVLVPVLWAGAPAGASSSVCTIVGTGGADHLTGTPGKDVICGRGGDDTIRGRGGADVLIGGSGDDVLIGGPGHDTLIGGPGRNRCIDDAATVTHGCGAARSPRRHRSLPVRAPEPPAPQSLPSPPTITPFPSQVVEPNPQPPVLESLEFADEDVEIAAGNWWAELSAKVWGEGGVASVEVSIEGPDGLPWRQIQIGSGGEEASLKQKIPVPEVTTVGTYRVSAVTIVDAEGKASSYDGAMLESEPLKAQFVVEDGPDHQGPQLEGIDFEPTPLDTSSGPVDVQVPIEASDAGSGVKAVRLEVGNPTNTPFGNRVYRAEATLMSGSAREGTWLATIPLPSGATAGFYPVERLELEDLSEHFTVIADQGLERRELPGGFTQVGAADTTKPELTSFKFLTPVIHSDRGEDKVEVEVGAADAWSGVSAWPEPDPVGRVDFSFLPPDWPVSWGASGDAPKLVSGDNNDGVWHFDRWLGEDAIQGTWRVHWIEVTDRAGNTVLLEDAPLEEFEERVGTLSFENLP